MMAKRLKEVIRTWAEKNDINISSKKLERLVTDILHIGIKFNESGEEKGKQ